MVFLRLNQNIYKAFEQCEGLYTVYEEIFTYNFHFNICVLIYSSSYSVVSHTGRAVLVVCGCPVFVDGAVVIMVTE